MYLAGYEGFSARCFMTYADFSSLRVCLWCGPLHASGGSNSGGVSFSVPVQIRGTRQVEEASEDVGVERFFDRRLGRDSLRG